MGFVEISALALSGIGFIYTLFLVGWLIICYLSDNDDGDK